MSKMHKNEENEAPLLIRFLQQKHGWSLETIAKKVKRHPNTISRWNAGHDLPQPHALIALRKLCGQDKLILEPQKQIITIQLVVDLLHITRENIERLRTVKAIIKLAEKRYGNRSR